MQEQIYIYQDNNRQGPFNTEQIQAMFASGKINANTLAWQPGMAEWGSLAVVLPEAAGGAQANALPPPLYQAGGDYADSRAQVLDPLYGVGGWLLFYCVCLTIIAPLLCLLGSVSGWMQAKTAFERYPLLETITTVEYVHNAIIMLFGVWVGIKLWGVKPRALGLLKVYLLVRIGSFAVLALAISLMAYPLGHVMASHIKMAAIGMMLREAMLFLLWWFYFKKSRRVQLTYTDSN